MRLGCSALAGAIRIMVTGLMLVTTAATAHANEIRYFTIGTAGIGGTYFPLA